VNPFVARLFLDMDGVLTDFDAQFQRWYGVRAPVARYKTDADVRRLIDRHLTGAPAEFWGEMPWLPGAEEFWNEMAVRSPVILSSPHFALHCRPGKLAWVNQHLGSQVEVILDTAKSNHGQPGDVLVDDTPENAHGWKGQFILHRDWDETRRQIGLLGGL